MARITAIGALRIADEHAFLRELRLAMREADGRIAVAAKALCVSVTQLKRWLAQYPDVPRAPEGRPRSRTNKGG